MHGIEIIDNIVEYKNDSSSSGTVAQGIVYGELRTWMITLVYAMT